MTTIRDQQLWQEQARDAIKIVCEKLDQGEVDWTAALKQADELKSQLSYYDVYVAVHPGEQPKPDRLDRTMALLTSLRGELEGKKNNHAPEYGGSPDYLFHNRDRARHYAQSILEILK